MFQENYKGYWLTSFMLKIIFNENCFKRETGLSILNVVVYLTFIVLQPERIDPPDPTRPDYDIRADVWSLGISMVSLSYP